MTVEQCTNLANALTDPKGSASSNSDEQSTDAFRDIPFDIKDRVLSLIDFPRDLLALSLTSREWSTMIIPLHIRYRELRIRANQPEIWQHLATRTDLSKNIREVCLMAPDDRRDQRLPLTLNCTDIPAEEIHPQPEMIQALSHFESLTSFTWLDSGQHCQFAEEVFCALTNCHGLVELIVGVPGKGHVNPKSSIWKICNLRILVLKRLDWVPLGGAEDSFISMLNNSPALEELTIPRNYTSAKFTSCRFPSLIKLHLSDHFSTGPFGPGGNSLTTNNLIVDFLFAHSGIQDLSWYPNVQIPHFLPQGLLPSIKHLNTNYPLTATLLSDDTLLKSRMLETIYQISLDLNTMRLLETINGSRLQEIHIWHCDGVETIRRLAVLFPSIKTLGIHGPKFSLDDEVSQDEFINCLAEFPLLTSLCDSPLLPVIQAKEADKKEEIIRKLYTQCSALKTIRNWSSMRRDQWRGDIVFFRDGLDVTWKQIVKDL